ncbi:MFS transporter [Geomonas terrae]|uniref:MFS transporter n=1 Tax=Geomonas terrae TaxID=2562681 RepID=A0A4S1CKP5_9BACT|nr:MFS transporter [Geomonas terrae]TGU74123.1 MFS transporter [Geomonas terrae]
MEMAKGIPLITDGNYRLFWTGQGLSWLGSVMQSVAQGWLVWSLTGSPAHLALTAVMLSLPVLLFGVLGGVSADRFDRRTLLLVTQLSSIVPSLMLGVLAFRGAATTPVIMALAFFQGALNAFDVPARQALLAELVPRERLGQAVACNAVAFNATRLLGPAAAGCLIASCGAASCFFINAVSFLAGGATLFFVRVPHRSVEHPVRRELLSAADLRGGMRFVMMHREIALLLTSVLLVGLLAIPFVPLLPVFADSFAAGPRGLGTMSASLGGGSLLAALWLAATARLPQRRDDHLPAGMLLPLALLLFALSTNYLLSLVALFTAGAAVVIFLARVNCSLQQNCPDRLRGRVMGAYTLALLGAAPIGSLLVGAIAACTGAQFALILTSSTCAACLAVLRLGRRREGTAATPWGSTLVGSDCARDW